MTVDTTKPVSHSHVLQRSRILSRCLVFAQSVLSFSAAAVLSGRETRTGWAHTFSVVTAIICGLEGLVHAALCGADIHMNIAFDIVAFTTCVLSYTGVVGLVTNTEDNQHPVPDVVEVAACLFVAAWGSMTARLVASAVQREAIKECTFELKFVPQGLG